MDYDLGPDVDELRQRLRGLIRQHIPAGFLGAFSKDPAAVLLDIGVIRTTPNVDALYDASYIK